MRPVLILVTLLGMIGAMMIIAAGQEASAFPGANGKIAYEHGSNIYAMNGDGSTPGVLRVDGEDPAWSANGARIAYTDTSTLNSNIWIMNADGSTPTQLSTGNADSEPAWSPDGNWIVFSRQETLTPHAGTATAADPTGAVLTDAVPNAFANVRVGSIVTKTVGGATAEVASKTVDTITTILPMAGGWAIGDAYTISAGGSRIYKIMASGAGLAKLSTAAATDYYNDYAPAWSPDGTKIAFSTSRNGNDDVYTMGITGTGLTNLTPDVGLGGFENVSWDPAWSPSGDKIAFASAEHPTVVDGTQENIWTMDADGMNKTNLTSVAADKDESATWSPDGASIAFERTTATVESIYVVPAAGGAATLLNAGPPNKARPDWQATLGGVADTYNVDEGATLVVPAAGVLINDLTMVSSVGAVTAVKDTDPANGALTFAADGSFTYIHNGSEAATDSFTYHPVQGAVTGSTATVTITIKPINDAPKAVDDGPYSVLFGESVSRSAPGVLGNDTDPEGGGLTAVKMSDPAHGTVTLNADGSFTYTNDGNPATTDSFTYKAKDSGGATSNTATVSFKVVVSLDVHTTGLVDTGQGKWYLYDEGGNLETSFFYGNPGDFPIMGDWDGDGVETPGMYRQSDGYVYLRNSNTVGIADIRFFFGNPGDVPIAGDFNSDGFDTVSIYRPSNQTFYIINELGKNDGGLGPADFSYVFGNPGDKAFVGDFDGNGEETVGLHRESTGLVYYRNEHSTGNADNQFIFGDPGDGLIAGDWTGNGDFTPALFRPSDTTMYFKYTNTAGNADNQFVPSPANSTWVPVSGQR
jgi:Tol biopolymer transport system component